MLQLTKGLDGRSRLVGKFSNRWRDWDFHSDPEHGGEIVASAAHAEFAEWLDKNPQHAPELWVWHAWGSAFKNRADWWGWSENAMYASWELTETEAERVVEWQDELKQQGRDLGMSFGFYVLKYDNGSGTIERYRAFEASVLPRDRAANPWTGVDILTDAGRPIKEEKMAFTKERYDALVKIHGREFADKLVREDEEAAAALDSAGFESKQAVDDVPTDETPIDDAPQPGDVVADDVEDDEGNAEESDSVDERDAGTDGKSLAGYAHETDVLEALTRLKQSVDADMQSVAAAIEPLSQIVASQQEIIKSLLDRLGSLESRASEEDVEAKMAAAPTGLLAAFLQPQSIVGKDDAVVDGRSSLARQAPSESGNKNPLISALFGN